MRLEILVNNAELVDFKVKSSKDEDKTEIKITVPTDRVNLNHLAVLRRQKWVDLVLAGEERQMRLGESHKGQAETEEAQPGESSGAGPAPDPNGPWAVQLTGYDPTREAEVLATIGELRPVWEPEWIAQELAKVYGPALEGVEGEFAPGEPFMLGDWPAAEVEDVAMALTKAGAHVLRKPIGVEAPAEDGVKPDAQFFSILLQEVPADDRIKNVERELKKIMELKKVAEVRQELESLPATIVPKIDAAKVEDVLHVLADLGCVVEAVAFPLEFGEHRLQVLDGAQGMAPPPALGDGEADAGDGWMGSPDDHRKVEAAAGEEALAG